MNWLGLLTGVPEAIASYFSRKQEIAAEKEKRKAEYDQAIHERKLDLIRQGLTADMNWEMEFAKQAETSWKDEFVLILLSIPLTMCFIPGMVDYVFMGFEALDKTPDWYQWLVLLIFCAVYGIRVFRRTQSDT